jgi:hypothetical protein
MEGSDKYRRCVLAIGGTRVPTSIDFCLPLQNATAMPVQWSGTDLAGDTIACFSRRIQAAGCVTMSGSTPTSNHSVLALLRADPDAAMANYGFIVDS